MRAICQAVEFVRQEKGPALLRLKVPRLSGHSGQDTQAYKDPELLARERTGDPLIRLRHYLIPALFSEPEWQDLEQAAEAEVDAALKRALARPDPDASKIRDFVFAPAMAAVSEPRRPQNGFASTWWRQFAAPWNMS